ncbi:MAG: hypothetical protein B6I28_04555 [Fusobacteriia bacterium 4572_132]|nr:MAG: hypothetical protein B6I28_04555 [Fusobacteriia bacterium 4572_132]
MRSDINARLLKYKSKDKKIFIQVDGLAYDILERAIEKNYTPFLKKMLSKKGYKKYKIISNLPSNTPASQMKIMYGLKSKIKGFRWYNKKENLHYSFKNPKTANYWENIAKKETKEELLKDGASYINIFTGGARRSLLTLSKMFETNKKMRIENNEIWKFIFLNADLVFKISYFLVKETILEFFESLSYKIKKKSQRHQPFFFYVRLTNNVFFKEIASLGAMLEMNEGVKKIYITYMGYDELGHMRGPETKEALRTLKNIDKSIKKVVKKAEQKGYEVYIFSDHGQTKSIPFQKKYGIKLKEVIKKSIAVDIGIKEYNAKYEHKEFMFFYGLEKILKTVIVLGYKPIEFIINKIFKYTKKHKKEKIDINEDIVVTNSGPMSHIYIKNIPKRMEESEILEKFPNLLSNLKKHNGIEFLAVKSKKGYKIMGKNGEILLNEQYEIIYENKNVFKNMNMSKKEVLKSLAEVIIGEDIGDIILFGAMLEENLVINFEEQYGGHGGIGGLQNFPFLITQNIIQKRGKTILDLYNIFREKGDD